MMWFFAVLIVVVMGGVALVAAGKGAPLSPAYDDRPDALVPRGRRLSGVDLRRVRFSLAFRGYRMSEVDALLDRLATELDSPPETEPQTEPQTEHRPTDEPVTRDEPDTPSDLRVRGDDPSD